MLLSFGGIPYGTMASDIDSKNTHHSRHMTNVRMVDILFRNS